MMRQKSAGAIPAKCVLLLIFCIAAQSATIDGSVSGTVVDNTGIPVPNARVVLSLALSSNSASAKAAGPPTITGPRTAAVTADLLGRFSATIPGGSYVACAQAPVEGFLDPCHWAAAAPGFNLTAGKQLTGVTITMARGAVVPIRVNDPQGLLTAVTGPFNPNCRFDVVTAKGLHYPARIQAQSAAGEDHAVTIPFGSALQLQVISPHLVLADSSGKTVSAAAPLSVALGLTATQLTYTVTGSK